MLLSQRPPSFEPKTCAVPPPWTHSLACPQSWRRTTTNSCFEPAAGDNNNGDDAAIVQLNKSRFVCNPQHCPLHAPHQQGRGTHHLASGSTSTPSSFLTHRLPSHSITLPPFTLYVPTGSSFPLRQFICEKEICGLTTHSISRGCKDFIPASIFCGYGFLAVGISDRSDLLF